MEIGKVIGMMELEFVMENGKVIAMMEVMELE